jgi:hypothetical protein
MMGQNISLAKGEAFTKNHLVIFTASCFSLEVIGIFCGLVRKKGDNI